MPSLFQMGNVFENQNALRRLRAAMRLIGAEVRGETVAVDAKPKQVEAWQKRRTVVGRWSENHAHWMPAIIDRIADQPEIIALGDKPTKLDSELAPEEVAAMDGAILQAVRDAVDAFKGAV